MENPLITALSTAPGVGGIAIIRLSGVGAWPLVHRVFQPKTPINWENMPGFTLHYGHIHYEGCHYDEVLVALMKKGSSYTKEEMAEIQCHGGFVAARRILELLLSLGAALAGPGEFTKRAFLNGRLDLAAAEAVKEIIEAGSEGDLALALKRLSGAKGKNYAAIRSRLLDLLAETEAAIDFPEDGLDDDIGTKICSVVTELIAGLAAEIKKAEDGQIYKNGIRTVILGRTNVGKSSLLNALVKEERAIVTDIPGTTRDTIEESLSLAGVPLVVMDTAGIRKTADPVEKMGVERSREAILKGDLVLLVLDAVCGLTPEDEELLQLVRKKKTIVLINKCDLIGDSDRELEKSLSPLPFLYISAKEQENLAALGEMIAKMFLSGAIAQGQDAWVGNLRHKEVFLRAKHHLEEALKAAEAGLPLDFQALDLRCAVAALGEIEGETISEEILERIFSGFCIGK